MTNIDQKVVGYDLWHLALPVNARRDHGIGAVEGTCEVVILRLTSEDGTEGWGEASPWAPFTGSPEASYAALDRYIRPHIVGARVADRIETLAKATRSIAHATEAKAALETAWLDLEGRLLGQTVAELLGGVKQSKIPLSVSIANPDFEVDVHLMERIRDDGVRIVKLKTGFRDLEFDIERATRIRNDFPEFSLRIDYNQGLSPDDALLQTPEIAKFDPDFIEQPVRFHEFDAMANLRTILNVPLLADESVFGPEDMARALREKILDGVSIKIMKAGGLSRAMDVARMASDAGLPAYGGDMFEAGLAHLAGAHMIAATPEIGLGCEFYQAKYYLLEDILSDPFPIEDGKVVLPDGPGLGIAPNLETLEKYRKLN